MRDQYVGDISDVLKFAFLRALTNQNNKTLGVAWYYMQENDGGMDGCHIEWQGEDAWKRLDHELYIGLVGLPKRSVAELEKAAIWPNGTLFYRDPIPHSTGRADWVKGMHTALDRADIVFLDPDNGLGTTRKHAMLSEIEELKRPNRSIVFITFPGRKPHKLLVQELHQKFSQNADAGNVMTLRTNVSLRHGSGSYVPRSRWFTVVNPDEELKRRAQEFVVSLNKIQRVKACLDT
ncbi:MAG: hypothetical protein B7X48_13545 [Acidiphilium sp. 34-60-192]|nr:MAG: hypothetical protein B7X48_13545 [Acidiphilium sp. 34-60-192]